MRWGWAMLTGLHNKRNLQLGIGLGGGVLFGLLLQKGGVTYYDIILGQLLLTDFTVLKIMLSAVGTGMVVVHLLRSLGLAQLHPKPGSLGSTLIGGLIFGVGFGILGYCPGTLAGATGQGSLDALFGGIVGLLLGAGIFAEIYPKLERTVLNRGYFGEITFPQLLKTNPWWVVIPVSLLLGAILYWLERAGL
ncbi:MAG: YeeE/YedE family protein [Desulfobacterota bacterium]|nr:YeeE/YedE family protein [Thermodesulfobacteriota bacterium]